MQAIVKVTRKKQAQRIISELASVGVQGELVPLGPSMAEPWRGSGGSATTREATPTERNAL